MHWHSGVLCGILMALSGAHLSGPANLKRHIWKALDLKDRQRKI